MIGSGNIDYSKNETHARKNYGISCVAKMDIETGTKLTASHLDFKRPGTGFKPYEINKIINKKTIKKIKKDEIITSKYF